MRHGDGASCGLSGGVAMSAAKSIFAESIFADRFDLAGCAFTRRVKPDASLIPHRHFEFALPLDLGRAHCDLYMSIEGQRVVARLYSIKSGEVSWYDVDAMPDKPTGTADAVGPVPHEHTLTNSSLVSRHREDEPR